MPNQFWESLLNPGAPWQTADGTAMANSVAETIISQSSPDFTVGLHCPPLIAGSVLKVTAQGKYSTTGTPTLQLRLRFGGVAGTLLLDSTAITTISGAANTTWLLEAYLVCRTIGASGTIFPAGKVIGLTSVTSLALLPASAPATATIDTTAQKAIVLTGQWGTASALNTITVDQWLIESLD